jgi:precorrin-4/cobalt-precorrin-4 C11-methyltransferase
MISFVGAGPGAADLITLRGAQRLAGARVVIWASSLVPQAVLDHCDDGVEVHDSATMTLEDVLAVYERHDEDAPIVRLHSGDPSLYGAIGEQVAWCRTHDRPWEIVPGVTSVSAAAAVAGHELTLPGISQSVVVTRLPGRTAASMPAASDGDATPDGSVTATQEHSGGAAVAAQGGRVGSGGGWGSGPTSRSQNDDGVPPEGVTMPEGVGAFARHGATMAVLLSAARPDELRAALLGPDSVYTADTPAIVVVRATWPDEQVVRTTVGGLADAIRGTGATMTALVLVGDVLDETDDIQRSHLYAPSYTTAYRLRSVPGSSEGRPSARRQG